MTCLERLIRTHPIWFLPKLNRDEASEFLTGKGSGVRHSARTTDTQRELFSKNLKLLGLGRDFGLKIFEAFGVFLAGLSAPILVLWVPCPCFPLFNHYFYKKIIWAAKNFRFSLHVSVVSDTVGWIEVKVAVLLARPCMPWNLLINKLLNHFWYFKYQILTWIC